jgi:transcriptional regulator
LISLRSGLRFIRAALLLTIDNKALSVDYRNQGAHMGAAEDRLHGHLDLLVLQVLAYSPMHGWAIAQRLQAVSEDVLRIGQGTIYPALRRLESEGWVTAQWRVSDAGRRARYYSLTASGRKQLARERAGWTEFVTVVTRLLDPA